MNENIRELNELVLDKSSISDLITTELSKVVVGQKKMTERLMIGLLTGGHILLEGVPGLAKTLAIKSLSQTLNASFNRIQFTPDLLPADLIGTMIYSQKNENFEVKKGPIFANFILADEINRSPAKVQSALLEAMEEKQVTIGDQSFKLKEPFIVMATQNPLEQEGTYPLPEAQVDRFMLKVIVDYPEFDDEILILRQNTMNFKPKCKQVASIEDILELKEITRNIYLDEKIENYITNIVFASRFPEKYNLNDFDSMISYGASPRATINLALASKGYAFLKRRAYVIPEDVRAIASDVLRHRIGMSYEAEAESITSDDFIVEILNKVEVP